MRLITKFLWLSPLMLVPASPASAQKCFTEDGVVALKVPACEFRNDNGFVADGAPIVRNEKAQVILTAYSDGKKAKGPTLIGIREASGRSITPAVFSHIKALSPWLAMGRVPGPQPSGRVFLIDLRTGAMRPTPYADIVPTASWILPGLLLGRFSYAGNDVALLDQAGMETGVQVRAAKLTGDDMHSYLTGPKTVSPGVLNYGDGLVTIEGKVPADGQPLFDGGQYGMFADTGRKAPGVTGEAVFGRPALDTLFLPLDAKGQMQPAPQGVAGIVRTELGWYFARERPGGGMNYQYIGTGLVPDMAAKPAGPQYSELHSQGLIVLGRTTKGWSSAGVPNPSVYYGEPRAAAQKLEMELSERSLAAVAAQAERKKAEADARLAAQQAELAALRADVTAEMDRALAGKWPEGDLGLKFLQDRVLNFGMEDVYRAKGLPMARFEVEACRRGRRGFCSETIRRAASSGSSFEWTWQKSFDAAGALSTRQASENCAAALKGAMRFCSLP
jgi:hypothetical protein